MNTIILNSFLFCTLLHMYILLFPYQAVITVPVADLLGQSITTIYPEQDPIIQYSQLPLCGGNIRSDIACPRLHQALFNEHVEVIEELDHEVKIHINNAYYMVPHHKKPQHTYWTLKKNITPYAIIPSSPQYGCIIPLPIDFNHILIPSGTTLTLTMPWYDSVTKQTYSAGTRFIWSTKNNKNYTILLYSPTHKNMVTTHIPLYYCLEPSKNSPQQCIKQFVQLLKQWAHNNHGFIPYVWGGCSVITTHKQNTFTEKIKTYTHTSASCYIRKHDSSTPKTGLDCTGLVVRAAQICGMPYFFKNSTTITQTLALLTPANDIEDGDLIWIPGHILIVSDVKHNLAIEARSYKHGFGKIHELPLNTIFKDIGTYKDLTDAFFEKKPLQRLDSKGIIADTFTQFKLLKIASIWH